MSLVGTRPILQEELRQYELHHSPNLYNRARTQMINEGIELYQDGDLIKYFVPNTLRELSAWIKKIKDFDNEKDMDSFVIMVKGMF